MADNSFQFFSSPKQIITDYHRNRIGYRANAQSLVNCSFGDFFHIVGYHWDSTIQLTPVVGRLDNAIHWINHYLMDSVVCFVSGHPLNSDRSDGFLIDG